MVENFFSNRFQKFIKTESLGGLLLFLATMIALVWANSNYSGHYHSFWNYKIGIDSDSFRLVKPLYLWLNDGLMTIFFFLIGLEIKREILVGELNTVKKTFLPAFAAIGGVVIPLIIYKVMNTNPANESGWGTTIATDIAFSLAIVSLLGKRVPLGLKIFLIAFAIIDDIVAVLIIAVFYSQNIDWQLILISMIPLFLLYFLSYRSIHSKYLIVVFGLFIWFMFLKSGIHPTLAGVLLAFAVPLRRKTDVSSMADNLSGIIERVRKYPHKKKPVLSAEQIEELDNLEDYINKVQSPLQQLEHRLHNWVSYLIMPLFALANAGIVFEFSGNIDLNLGLNIATSLFLGKLIGITLFSLIAIRLNLGALPKGVHFLQLVGIASIAGVGFTMSIFIANLAFPGNEMLINSAKIGILEGSLISGIIGVLIMRFCNNKKNCTA